ncbi:MAG TPA: DUF5996 family protein [Rhizomicrobium sp.]|nr:DUF5996 family protein [Rhizomicrobium sp.]
MIQQSERWPALPYAAWRDTAATLLLWTQIVGKLRVAQTPWLNHSWHGALYVTARGLSTSPIRHAGGVFDCEFDFVAHRLAIRADNGGERHVALRPQSVAAFYRAVMDALEQLGVPCAIDRMPNEVPDAMAFDRDEIHKSYDADAAHRFWRVLVQCDRVFKEFRTGFLGKASPVHFFWGSFDLAVTRFSGRAAPLHPGGIPHLPDAVVREAYSHEVSSAGFWPGGGAVEYPAYYSYAYPTPARFAGARVHPSEAFFSRELGEFLLPYEAVRTASDPKRKLMEFLQSTYLAAANLGNWDRERLDCALGEPGRPRPLRDAVQREAR